MWPVPLLMIIPFAPESPWWLVRKGRIEAAEHSVRRLTTKSAQEAKNTVAMMLHTAEIEMELQAGASYLDCFKGTNLRRTEICCFVFVANVAAGIYFANSPTYFFEQAGVTASNTYKLSLGGSALGFIGTLLGSVLIARYGRRPLFLEGMILLTILLLIIGFVSIGPTTTSASYAQVAMTLLWVFVFDTTIGTGAYTISSEVSAVKLRVKTVSLAKNTHNISNIVGAVLEPYMINPTSWNWKGKTAFFWAGTSAIAFRLPETKDRSYEDLDILFSQKLSARKFAQAVVDPYAYIVPANVDEKEQTV